MSTIQRDEHLVEDQSLECSKLPENVISPGSANDQIAGGIEPLVQQRSIPGRLMEKIRENAENTKTDVVCNGGLDAIIDGGSSGAALFTGHAEKLAAAGMYEDAATGLDAAGGILKDAGDKASSVRCYNLAAELWKHLAEGAIERNDSRSAAEYLQNVALCHCDAGDNASAAVHFALSVQYFAAIGDHDMVIKCSEMAATYTDEVKLTESRVSDYKSAAEFWKHMAEDIDDGEFGASCLYKADLCSEMAATYTDEVKSTESRVSDYKSAAELWKHMAKEAIDSNNSEFAARCLQNVALCHYDAGDNALATVHFALSAQYFAAAGNYCRAAECSEKAAICTSDVELSVCYYKLAAKYYMKINQSDSATEMNTKAEIEHDRVGRFDFPDQKMIPNYLKEMSNACKEYAAAAKVEEVLLQIAKRSEALAQKCMSDVFYYEWCSHLSNELTKDLWKQISNSDKFEDKDLWKQIRYFDKFEETLHACLTHRKTVKDLWGEFRYFDETKEVLHVCLASHKLAKDAYAQIGNSDKVKEMLYEIMKDLRLLEVLQVLRDLHRKGLANVETNEAYVECLVQLEELYMATGDMVSAIEFINEARHRLLLTKKCFRFAKNKAKARECSAKAKRYADMVSGILRALPATANTSARLENRRAVIPRVMLTFASKIGNLLRANGREAATVEETQKINDTAVDPNAI